MPTPEKKPASLVTNLKATPEEQEAAKSQRWDPIAVNANDLVVKPEKRAFPKFAVSNVIIKQNDVLSRIVFNITGLANSTMEKLGEFLFREIEKIKAEYPSANFWGSASPMYRGQWDMGLEYLDSATAPILRDRILQLLEIFSRSIQESQGR